MSIFRKMIPEGTEYPEDEILKLKNRIWKLEHPAKFKTGDNASYSSCGQKKIITIVNESFDFDRNGQVMQRAYLCLSKNNTLVCSEFSLSQINNER